MVDVQEDDRLLLESEDHTVRETATSQKKKKKKKKEREKDVCE
jgi:hypothetical protein